MCRPRCTPCTWVHCLRQRVASDRCTRTTTWVTSKTIGTRCSPGSLCPRDNGGWWVPPIPPNPTWSRLTAWQTGARSTAPCRTWHRWWKRTSWWYKLFRKLVKDRKVLINQQMDRAIKYSLTFDILGSLKAYF